MKQFVSIFIAVFVIQSTNGQDPTQLQYIYPDTSCFRVGDIWGAPTYTMLRVLHDTLYISGAGFDTVGCDSINVHLIGAYNGYNFYKMGMGLYPPDEGLVYDVAYYRDTLFFVGGFTNLDGVSELGFVGRWVHDHWVHQNIVDINVSYGDGYSIEVHNDTLFIGGSLLRADGQYFRNLYGRDNYGKIFSVNGIVSHVFDLQEYRDKVYAIDDYLVKRYNPINNTFEPVGWFNGYTHGFLYDPINSFLYISGEFTWAVMKNDSGYYSFDYATAVARWDGFEVKGLGTGQYGPEGFIMDMALYRGYLYAGGGFDNSIDGMPTGNIVVYYDDSWHSVGPDSGEHIGLYAGVHKMTVYKDTLYVNAYWITDVATYGNDTLKQVISRFYLPPDTTCHWLQPLVQIYRDTFYIPIDGDGVVVNFYNNNPYAESWHWDFATGDYDSIRNPVYKYRLPGTYNVKVTVTDDGCVKTASRKVVIVYKDTNQTSISEEKVKEQIFLKVYPNPAHTVFNVETFVPPQVNVGLFSVNTSIGTQQLLKKLNKGYNKFQISVENWEKGWYVCSVIFDNKPTLRKKIIIN